jgi:predicted Zn-ribbon and HTH transcriptional regulator
LAATDILLNRDRYDSESAEVLDAEQVRHLWKYEMHTHRSPRARQDAQYRASQSRQLVTLGSLSGEELHTFRDELCERLDHARQYAYIAEAIDIFLENAPPSYPTIDPGLFDDSAERKEHQNALHGLSRPVTPAAARDTDEQIGVTARPSVDEVLHRAEYDAVTRLLQAESELGARALQPLVYTRTMRPAQPLRDWTLLYKRHRPSQEELEKRYRKLPPRVRQQKINQAQEHNDGYVYRFVLAMVVHNTTPHAFTGDRPADYFAPDIREGDYSYVNFPLTPFKRPDDVSLMIFPLECGEEHQEDLLHALIERLRAEQLARYESQFTDPQQNTADHKPVEECLPRQAALGEAKIITRLNGDDRYEFFLHCAVPVITATRETPTERILGLHQHQNGYSWALIDQTGALIEAGDLHIPWHVQPRPGQSAYSDNYAFEVANQIVALAQEHNALIGIENTWTNKKVSTSADQNRRVFSHPSRKIYDQVVHKARQAGLPYPRIVYGVSPRRCGTCGNRTKNKRSKEALNACPACGSLSRAAHMQFPLASLAPMADGSAAALVLLAREQENGVRAAVITDFFYWTLRQAADVVPPPDVRQAFVAGLEQVQWRGRHIFQAKTGRDHHTYRMRQAKPNGTEQLAFRPRRLGADVIIAGPEALAPYVQEWIDAYASVAPDVRIEYVSTSRKRALAFLYRAKKDAVADVVLLDTPTSERELAAGLDKKRGWFCQDCGHHWHAEEIQFRCTYPPCRHNDLARYNTAMVVAQLTIRKLLEYNQQQSQGTPAGTADS